MGTMPPAFAAAIARRNAKKKKGGKPNPFVKGKGKTPVDAEDLKDKGVDEASESDGKVASSNGGMPPGLAKYMAAHHGKK